MTAEQELELYAVADFDLQWCQRYLVAYVELMTPPEEGEPDAWLTLRSREYPGEHNFLDILGRSLAQSIIVSYSRPWSRNQGKGPSRLPESLFTDMAKLYRREAPEERLLPFDHSLHDRILRSRNKIVAHSDRGEWAFDVECSDGGTQTNLTEPFEYLSLDEARALVENTQSLRSELAEYRRRALSSLEGSS